MGVETSVYVGPFLRCQPRPGTDPDLYGVGIEQDKLNEMGRETRKAGSEHIFTPNRGWPRQFGVEPESCPSGIVWSGGTAEPSAEVRWLHEWLGEDLAKLRAAYATVWIDWGMVVDHS